MSSFPCEGAGNVESAAGNNLARCFFIPEDGGTVDAGACGFVYHQSTRPLIFPLEALVRRLTAYSSSMGGTETPRVPTRRGNAICTSHWTRRRRKGTDRRRKEG